MQQPGRISLEHVDRMIALDHLDRMTDATGLIQHAIYSIPRRESGYTTDDNARALRLCTRLWCQYPDENMLRRVGIYLSFMEHARTHRGGFHNFMDYQRNWLDAEGTGDCQGQAIRSLAEVLGSNLPEGFRAVARELVETMLPTLADLRSLRAQAYVIMAWGHLWAAGAKDIEPLENIAWTAVGRMREFYERNRRPDWPWFESRMTYANAVLPHAMFVAGKRWPKESFLEIATDTFDFLDRSTTVDNFFWPVGNDGWYVHGEEKAAYDQQPVEAVVMADAALAAHEMMRDEKYLATFHRVREWFHGGNSLKKTLVDVPSGSCYDGLQRDGVNYNQGAESTLAYLWTELRSFEFAFESQSDRVDAAAGA
jgi:hypothetical protein